MIIAGLYSFMWLPTFWAEMPPAQKPRVIGGLLVQSPGGSVWIFLIDNAARRSHSTGISLHPVSSYTEALARRFEHGKTRLWIEPVPRRLRRPHEAWPASARGLPSLPRAGPWPDRFHLRSPHVRDHALLGARFSGLGRGRSRVRGGVPEQTEVGRVSFAQVRWPQRHSSRQRFRKGHTQSEGRVGWRDPRWRTSSGAKPH